jgi:hypothetical protein
MHMFSICIRNLIKHKHKELKPMLSARIKNLILLCAEHPHKFLTLGHLTTTNWEKKFKANILF